MHYHYEIIASAIRYIAGNAGRQPSLEEVAEHVHLSPFHMQRIFTEWAGVSPKRFLQFLTVEHAKKLLTSRRTVSLFDTAIQSGLSGTGRLHDLFTTIEGMTPAEFRQGGHGLVISFSTGCSRFGNYLVASTPKGICTLEFFDGNEATAREVLRTRWPAATIIPKTESFHDQVARFFTNELDPAVRLRLHVQGTGFQVKVWNALLKIPEGHLSSYGEIAEAVGQPSASRAVGSAIGANQVAVIIPCHRVIRSQGLTGDFRWGSERKKAIIGWEAAQREGTDHYVY